MAEVPDVVHASAPTLSHQSAARSPYFEQVVFIAAQPTAQEEAESLKEGLLITLYAIRRVGSLGFDTNLASFNRAL